MKLLTYLRSLFQEPEEEPVFISQEDQRILDHLYMLDLMDSFTREELTKK